MLPHSMQARKYNFPCVLCIPWLFSKRGAAFGIGLRLPAKGALICAGLNLKSNENPVEPTDGF